MICQWINVRANWLCFGAFPSSPAPCLRLHRALTTGHYSRTPPATEPPSVGAQRGRVVADPPRWLLLGTNHRIAKDSTGPDSTSGPSAFSMSPDGQMRRTNRDSHRDWLGARLMGKDAWVAGADRREAPGRSLCVWGRPHKWGSPSSGSAASHPDPGSSGMVEFSEEGRSLGVEHLYIVNMDRMRPVSFWFDDPLKFDPAIQRLQERRGQHAGEVPSHSTRKLLHSQREPAFLDVVRSNSSPRSSQGSAWLGHRGIRAGSLDLVDE